MIICPGEGCGVRAKSDRALTTHLKTCDKAKAGLALVGTEVERREEEYQRAKRRKISSSRHLEIAPEVMEPVDVDFEVCSVDIDLANTHVSRVSRMMSKRLPPHHQWTYLFRLLTRPCFPRVATVVDVNCQHGIKMRTWAPSRSCRASRRGGSKWRRRRRQLRQRDVKDDPPQHPPSHQLLQSNSRRSERRQMSSAVLESIVDVQYQNSPTHPSQITMTL